MISSRVAWLVFVVGYGGILAQDGSAQERERIIALTANKEAAWMVEDIADDMEAFGYEVLKRLPGRADSRLEPAENAAHVFSIRWDAFIVTAILGGEMYWHHAAITYTHCSDSDICGPPTIPHQYTGIYPQREALREAISFYILRTVVAGVAQDEG